MIDGVIWGRAAWDLLGLEPGADRQAIRRAYARLLKATNPEDNPEGFQQLRQAYEWALACGDFGDGDEVVDADLSNLFEIFGAARAPVNRVRLERASADETDPLLRLAQGRLRDLLAREDNVGEAEWDAALNNLLQSPGLEAVQARLRTETWLAELIADNAPRSDPLAPLATRVLAWEARNRDPAVRRLIERQEALARWRKLLAAGGPWDKAGPALGPGPARRRLILALTEPGLTGRVRTLLDQADAMEPEGAPGLDPEAAAWWRRWLSGPRPRAGGVWAALLAPILMVFVAGPFGLASPLQCVAVWVAGQAGCLLLLPAEIALVQWPRRIWRETFAWRTSFPVAVAPLAASVALIFAAAAPLPEPVGLWGLGLGCGLTLLAAAILGDLAIAPGGEPPWPIRLVLLNAALPVIWMLLMRPALDSASALRISLAGTTGILVSTLTLQDAVLAWLVNLGRNGRLLALILLLSLAAFIVLTLSPGHDLPELRPWTAVMTIAVVLLHRPAVAAAPSWAHRGRVFVQWFGGMAIFYLGLGLPEAGPAFNRDQLLFDAGVLWLVAGVAIALVASLLAIEDGER